METPRTASQTLKSETSRGNDGDAPRTPASRRLIGAAVATPTSAVGPQFAVLPLAGAYQPSRKKEEARALQNLRRRLQAVRVLQANRAEPIEASCANNNLSPEEIDNRSFLLQKILTNRPMSMVLEHSEIRTAWQDSDFITDCLCWHNVYRQRHAALPLTMSSELCYLAQTWANHLAHTNKFYYRNDKDIGQNLFCKPSNGLVQEVTGQEVATYWYSSVRHYDHGSREPDYSHVNINAGHFTQMVWASTRLFGVGKARSRSGKLVVVAHYAPPGNLPGAYSDNVLTPGEYFHHHHQQLQQSLPPTRLMAATTSSCSSCTTSPST